MRCSGAFTLYASLSLLLRFDASIAVAVALAAAVGVAVSDLQVTSYELRATLSAVGRVFAWLTKLNEYNQIKMEEVM